MCRVKLAALVSIAAIATTPQVNAQSLRVSPVTIDLPPVARSSILNIGNESNKALRVQARVFRWTQHNGEDVLEKTSDVVISPPILTVNNGNGGVARVVRVSEAPVRGEETYRILIDEIPDRTKMQSGGVALLVRQSIPVFFSGLDARKGGLSWTAKTAGNKVILSATNSGEKRVKLTKLKVTDGSARKLADIAGLAGYVLGGQTKTWTLTAGGSALGSGTTLSIEAASESGPINAQAIVGKSG